MNGYVGLTDPEWFSFLAAHPKVDEVNFWQPHGSRTFRALQPGEPFFFKLRGSGGRIGGFAFFTRFASLPAWLAWDCFGEMNGAPDFESMVRRIMSLRREDGPSARAGDFPIGCIILSAPVFFKTEEWVVPPTDWAKTGIQQGKLYDLSIGEGRRLYYECIDQAKTGKTSGKYYWNIVPETGIVKSSSGRYGSPITIQPRLGQGQFSLAVRDAYNGACAVTHEHSGPVLEAAHIKPFSLGGDHLVSNGLLLRRDLHRLFDLGYVTVTTDYRFKVGESLREEYHNGRSYYALDGQQITVPTSRAMLPDPGLLDWHGRQIFKG